jgi:hypothetical protein
MAHTDGLALSAPGDRKPPSRPTVLRRFHAALLLLGPERPICPGCCCLAACEAAPDRLKPRVPGPGRGSAW